VRVSEDVIGLIDGQRRAEEELLRVRQLLAEANQIIAETAQRDKREWITLPEMAARIKRNYSVVYRAYESGRLVTRVSGGGPKNDRLLCDPTTYIPAKKGPAKGTTYKPRQPK